MGKPQLTWRKQPNIFVRGSHGYDLRHKGKQLGGAYPLSKALGYYCWGRWDEMGVPLINTANEPVGTMDEAKAILKAHFHKYLDNEQS